jgi:hydrogenase nickel incorporation protein HypB
VLINKIDLLPHLDVSVERIEANVHSVHPGVPTMRLSARTGEGIEQWRDWLVSAATRSHAGAPA